MIIFRRGNSSAANSFVLAQGEPGYVTDTARLYVGDGSTPISGLPYTLQSNLLVSADDVLSTYATQAQLAGYVQTSTLAGYVSNSSLTTTLGSYATTSSLSGYVPTSGLAAYTPTTGLDAAVAPLVNTSGGATQAAVAQYHQPAVYALKYVPAGTDPTTTDVSVYVQQAIDEAAATGATGLVYWPPTAVVAEIYVRTNVRIVGPTHGRGSIHAVPGSTRKGVVSCDPAGGVVSRFALENIQIFGNSTNTSQFGMYFKASQVSGGTGGYGVWYSDFRNIKITDTLGGGIWLEAGGADNLGPHQFLTFSQVSIQLTSGTSTPWIGILCTGQVCQVTWNEVESSYRGTSGTFGAASLQMTRTTDDTNTETGADVAPGAMVFNACTFQGSTQGVFIKRANGIIFNACWFEDNQSGFHVTTSATSIEFNACHFADTSNNAGNGYVGRVEDSCVVYVNMPTTVFSSTYDYVWQDTTNLGGAFVISGIDTSTEAKFTGLPKATNSGTATSISLGPNPYVALAGTGIVDTLQTTLPHGSTVTIRLTAAMSFKFASGNLRAGIGNSQYGISGTASVVAFPNNTRLEFQWDKGAGVFTLTGATSVWNPTSTGMVTLAAGTATVAYTPTTANIIVRLNRQTPGGTLGELSFTPTAGTGFAINSTSNTETSKVYFEVLAP